MEAEYLKAIDFFLIVLPQSENARAYAISNDILTHKLKDLVDGTDNLEVKDLLDSLWMHDLAIDSALLQG